MSVPLLHPPPILPQFLKLFPTFHLSLQHYDCEIGKVTAIKQRSCRKRVALALPNMLGGNRLRSHNTLLQNEAASLYL